MGIKEKGDKLYEDLYDIVRRKSAISRRIKEFKKKTTSRILSEEQQNEVKQYYASYKTPNLVFHEFFTEKTGEFHADYIPIDLYVGYIDPYFNNIKEAKYVDNKCYFGALFHTIPQPVILVKRVNNIWMTGENEPISFEKIETIISGEDGVFFKEAQTSAGGHGVTYIPANNDVMGTIKKLSETTPTDVLIQRRLYQHARLAAINPSSVNTLRIYSVLGLDGKVTNYSTVLRTGVGDTKVDNYASGGLSIGVTENGRLKKNGYNKKGVRVEKHPTTGLVFENYEIPSFDMAIALVRKAHIMVPHFRSVSWDIAITADGSPVLIEGNLCRGGIDLLQLSNGPLYGKDTIKILDEVFGKEKISD